MNSFMVPITLSSRGLDVWDLRSKTVMLTEEVNIDFQPRNAGVQGVNPLEKPFPRLTQRRLWSTDLVHQSLHEKATCQTTYRESTLTTISQSACASEFDDRLHSFKYRMRKRKLRIASTVSGSTSATPIFVSPKVCRMRPHRTRYS